MLNLRVGIFAMAFALAKSPSANADESALSLDAIKHIGAKGRAQDAEFNSDPMLARIVAGRATNVPWLIQQLTSEAPAANGVIDFWPSPTVGDVAFLILTDLAARTDGTACLPGGTWNEILGDGNNAESGHTQLRTFVRKYGRKELKARWRQIWERAKDRIVWDESARCLRTPASGNENPQQ